MKPVAGTVRLDRRAFLRQASAAGAGLVISFYLPGGAAFGSEAKDAGSFAPNAWLEIDRQGDVMIWVGRSEMGQGARTSVAMIMADELGADWSRVHVKQADLDDKYGQQLTGGSQSIRYAWANLRQPAAAAREMLITAAAEELRVPARDCFAKDSVITHRPSGRRLAFGDIVERTASLRVLHDPPLKDPKDFSIIGTSRNRVDGPRIVTGSAGYGIDVKVPGMLYATVARCPVFGGKVKRFDATRAKQVRGVLDVVEVQPVDLPVPFSLKPGGPGHQHYVTSGVAVVGDSTWAAMQGRDALDVEWDEGPGAAESTTAMRDNFRQLALGSGTVLRNVGDPEATFAQAAKKVEAEYELPFLAHAPMEPPNCTALVRDGRSELWVATQNAPAVRAALEMTLRLPPSSITVHVTLLGGGFGRRLNMDYALEAALISRAVGAPVKVLWTREDDLQHDYYRAAGYHHIRAGLDHRNRVVAWIHHLVLPTTNSFYDGRPGADDDGSDVSGGRTPNGTVPNFRIEYTDPKTYVPRGWWRAVDSTGNLFVQQSFVDEVAAAAGKDPLALRRELFGKPQSPPSDPAGFNLTRLLHVYDLAAEKAAWGGPLPKGRGRGIAGQFAWDSYVAQVAEVSVGNSGAVSVDRVVCAADVGRVINPDMVVAQMEGGIAFGLAAALHGAITIDRGRVKQSNFHDYPVLRMNEMPRVEVYLVPSQERPGGVGEPGVPPIAPAVGNAIFAATGKRIRRLPFRAEDLKQA